MPHYRTHLCVVIPTLDCAESLPKIVRRASQHASNIDIIDDGSHVPVTHASLGKVLDGTSVRIQRHATTRGYGASIAAGMEDALKLGARVIVLLDADGQHPPEQIPKLTAPILANRADIVIGSRYMGVPAQGIPWWRDIGIRAITLACNLRTGLKLTDAQSGFRAFSRRAARACLPQEKGMEASLEILLKARKSCQRITEVPARIRYPPKKDSSLRPWIRGASLIAFLVKPR